MSLPLSPNNLSQLISRLTTAVKELVRMLLEALAPQFSPTLATHMQRTVRRLVNEVVLFLVEDTDYDIGLPRHMLLQARRGSSFTISLRDQKIAPVTPSNIRASDKRMLDIVHDLENLAQMGEAGARKGLEAALSVLAVGEPNLKDDGVGDSEAGEGKLEIRLA
jgi:hypothetical protein